MRFPAALLLTLWLSPSLSAYATFTHQELIDLAWEGSIRPLLEKRFPGATPSQIDEAHAYAYGGCLIQDLGYYPFGKAIFSDLAHYVRSGDFVSALLRGARNRNEFAFAIGALSHYIGDSIGHAKAVNPATALMFPDVERKYGGILTYEDAPTAHVRTEFGFDVAQLAMWRYAPRVYRKYIGLRVSRPALDRAFAETYGLSVRSILGPQRSAIGSYRFAVRKLLPLFARATVLSVRRHLPQETPDPALRRFLANVSHTDYSRHWSKYHHDPGIQAHLLEILIYLIPKIGVLKILAIKAPTAQTEDLFLQSVNSALDTFRKLLAELSENPQGGLVLANRDLDTGDGVRPGTYKLMDKTYAKLLDKVTSAPRGPIPRELLDNILAYYANPQAPNSVKKDHKQWAKVQEELTILREYRCGLDQGASSASETASSSSVLAPGAMESSSATSSRVCGPL